MVHDPIVALISSFEEGPLIQGTIASVTGLCKEVIIYEGPTELDPVYGEATDIAEYVIDVWVEGKWLSETEKRNRMLSIARQRMRNIHNSDSFWILTIDADEVLLYPEFLHDWLNMLHPGYPESHENVVPLKRTEPAFKTYVDKDGRKLSTWHADIVPSRLVHSSFIKKYTVGCAQFETPDGLFANLNTVGSPVPVQHGEPHIHHRHYMRRGDRAKFRANEHEEKRVREANLNRGEFID